MENASNRIAYAKDFLFNNPTESKACAARIFGLSIDTLKSSIRRDSPNKIDRRGGHNKVLEQHQVEAIHKFIRSLLTHDIPPTKTLLFTSIQHLKRKENANFEGPTKRWFRDWWQANKLHTIKTKPLATIRYSAAQVDDVHRWFEGYRVALRELKIKDKRNIINFDEAGFRVGCMKGQIIIVPDDVNEYYAISPEDRRSLTVFEMINAAGDFPTPPLVVIQGQQLMSNWFSEGLPTGTRILTSETGFTSDKIALTFLEHYIGNSDASPTSDWKLMLIDNHGSHLTPEFIQLANEDHIRPYPLIPHMTHCMQPLDVAVFQPYSTMLLFRKQLLNLIFHIQLAASVTISPKSVTALSKNQLSNQPFENQACGPSTPPNASLNSKKICPSIRTSVNPPAALPAFFRYVASHTSSNTSRSRTGTDRMEG